LGKNDESDKNGHGFGNPFDLKNLYAMNKSQEQAICLGSESVRSRITVIVSQTVDIVQLGRWLLHMLVDRPYVTTTIIVKSHKSYYISE